MTLAEGAAIAAEPHIRKALKLFQEHGGIDGGGLAWLYSQTGRSEPKTRYVVIDDLRLPTKAFGCLVAQLAGNTNSTTNELTTNQAAAPFKRAKYVEVVPGKKGRTAKEREAEDKTYYEQLARPEQKLFRDELMRVYSERCAVSGCDIREALEAAHIHPFAAGGRSDASNGILLRVDLHKLFDAGKLGIDPRRRLAVFSKDCVDHYCDLHRQPVRVPKHGPDWSMFEVKWADMKTKATR